MNVAIMLGVTPARLVLKQRTENRIHVLFHGTVSTKQAAFGAVVPRR